MAAASNPLVFGVFGSRFVGTRGAVEEPDVDGTVSVSDREDNSDPTSTIKEFPTEVGFGMDANSIQSSGSCVSILEWMKTLGILWFAFDRAGSAQIRVDAVRLSCLSSC